MSGIIPVAILLAGAVGVTVLRFVPRGTGFAWLFSVFCSVAAWIVFFVGKNNLPFLYSGQLYADIAIDTIFPAFQINLINWPMILSVLAVVTGTIISSATRIGFGANTVEWTGVLLFGVIGMGACSSQNVLTALFFISLFDIWELFVTLTKERLTKGIFLFVFWRLASLVILFAVFSLSDLNEQNSNKWETLKSIPAQLTLIACILRMGIFPSKSIAGIPCEMNRSFDISRHIIGLIISATIVVQLPAFSGNEFNSSVILLYLFMSIVGSLVSNKTNKQEFTPFFWLSAGGAFLCAEYLYGYSAAAIMFLIAITPVLFILTLPIRSGKFYLFIGLFSIFSFSGLPFTPNNSGLNGFTTKGTIPGFLFLVAIIPIFYYLIKSVFSEKREDQNLERWAATIAPIGSLFLVISSWFIRLFWQPDAIKFDLSLQAMLMTLGGISFFIASKFKLFNLEPEFAKVQKISKEYVKRMTRPIYSINWPSFGLIEKLYSFIINLFESDGGFLWSILCLVLIITIISGTGLN